ncbi:hypothetical protein [Agromyces sp. NBRC 114283]|uniref:hypothetical protein n=1 Tax=Agromyces sp. NBRC 114283 TaxID=2994521 RepID=UPI0024A3A02F|nr:hypothetical protein [Agromyces sp. NBRC 114283]GLU88891.1 hypothetical protein Agsp01_11460 [Agromyces sp. NBRC 114283]
MTDLVLMDEVRARRLTERIRLVAANVAENVETLRQLVSEAKGSNVHQVLGYPSWTAYLKDVFGDEPLRLARDVRQELVAELSAQGMSTRAIAPIVGVSPRQITTDIRDAEGVNNFTPGPQTMMQVDPDTGEVEDIPARHVTGLDGKEYAVPVQKKPPRDASSHAFHEADLINSFSAIIRTTFTPDHVAQLSDAARARLVLLLSNAISTLEGSSK